MSNIIFLHLPERRAEIIATIARRAKSKSTKRQRAKRVGGPIGGIIDETRAALILSAALADGVISKSYADQIIGQARHLNQISNQFRIDEGPRSA